VLEQQSADHRSEADADRGHSCPHPDRSSTLVWVGEHVGDDRKRRRHDERTTNTHEGARSDEHQCRRSEGGQRGTDAEDDESSGERAVATEPVAEAPCREQQAREHQDVRVDNPLEFTPRRAQTARSGGMSERRERDVENRVVEADHEQAEAEDRKDHPATVQDVGRVAQVLTHVVLPGSRGRRRKALGFRYDTVS
jgi:hypothetical protein